MYNKITVGYVVQTYDDDGKIIGQDFIAGDEVHYEEMDGTPLDQDEIAGEEYFPFNMEQPPEVSPGDPTRD